MHQNSDMLASESKVVFDLYEWLPPYGETSLSFRMEGLKLEVNVFYAFPSDGPAKLRKKTLVFGGVCSFLMTAFPGVRMSPINHEGLTVNGSLLEFT